MLAVDERENVLLRNGWVKTYMHSMFQGHDGWRYAFIGQDYAPAIIESHHWLTLDEAWEEQMEVWSDDG